jgi:hypothetical protein
MKADGIGVLTLATVRTIRRQAEHLAHDRQADRGTRCPGVPCGEGPIKQERQGVRIATRASFSAMARDVRGRTERGNE